MELLIHHLAKSTLEGETPRQEFINHDGEGILVACRDRMAIQLFRCHIDRCAPNGLAGARGRATESSKTKVSQQQIREIRMFFVVADKEVGGFDILVNDLMVMGILESFGSLMHDVRHSL